jgi:hypothetical protein
MAGQQGRQGTTAPENAAVHNDLARSAAAELTGKITAESLLLGCWRAVPPLVPDTLLRDPRIVERRGDTLVVVVSSQRPVTVVQRGDTLRGELNATRTECPLARPPDSE